MKKLLLLIISIIPMAFYNVLNMLFRALVRGDEATIYKTVGRKVYTRVV